MFPLTRWSIAGVCCLACIEAIAGPPPAWSYSFSGATIAEIGSEDNDPSVGYDINDNGEIVGAARLVDADSDAFYFNGNMVNISWISGVMDSKALSINNNGEVVGETYALLGPYAGPRAFYWKIWHPFTYLDSNPAYGQPYQWSTHAQSINDAGVIVGYATRFPHETPPPNTLGECYGQIPLRWQSSTAAPATVFCPEADGKARANAINDGGVIVGDADSVTAATRMYRWDSGTRTTIPAPAPSTYAVLNVGSAVSINNSNAVVGHFKYQPPPESCSNCQKTVAFHWDGGSSQSTVLGTLNGGRESAARDINTQGMVVGYSERRFLHFGVPTYVMAAFIWHPNFGMRALPPLPVSALAVPKACGAYALNNRKGSGLVQVTGECIVNGKGRAVRWDVTIARVILDSPTQ